MGIHLKAAVPLEVNLTVADAEPETVALAVAASVATIIASLIVTVTLELSNRLTYHGFIEQLCRSSGSRTN